MMSSGKDPKGVDNNTSSRVAEELSGGPDDDADPQQRQSKTGATDHAADDTATATTPGFSEVVDDFGKLALEKKQKGGLLIRLERGPDDSADMSSVNDVMAKIKQVRSEQSQYGCSQLYGRTWKYNDNNNDNDDVVNGDHTTTKNNYNIQMSFSVAQFNALAEGLSSGPSVKRPFGTRRDDKDTTGLKDLYGGFSSIPHPHAILDFESRKWRILEAIQLGGEDADTPPLYDLIAMEEVDRYRGFFKPIMKMCGYEGLFIPKQTSPCVRMGWYSDGCCLFWKHDVFELVSEYRNSFKGGNQVYIVATLRHRVSNMLLVVAVTHLKASQSNRNENLRCRQVEELLGIVETRVSKIASNNCQAMEDVPVLIMGDFNADPPSQIEHSRQESAIGRVLAKTTMTMKDESGRPYYQSAYNVEDPPKDLFTTWKIRGSSETKRIIDYIFYAGPLRCKAILQVPTEIEPTRLPSLRFPSDHLHIGARFEIVDES